MMKEHDHNYIFSVLANLQTFWVLAFIWILLLQEPPTWASFPIKYTPSWVCTWMLLCFCHPQNLGRVPMLRRTKSCSDMSWNDLSLLNLVRFRDTKQASMAEMSTDYSLCTGMELTFHEHMCNISWQKWTSSPTPTQQEQKDLILGPWIGPRGYQQDVCAWAQDGLRRLQQ